MTASDGRGREPDGGRAARERPEDGDGDGDDDDGSDEAGRFDRYFEYLLDLLSFV